jgi:CPA2 family monovalent cation:H+ antiporter-2
MLLFHLGLEFSVERLLGGGRRLALAGGTYLVLNIGGGYLFGSLLGWGTKEALVLAGAMGISSSAIVTKLLVELRRVANRETTMILGIIVVEDVFLAFYLALLQPIFGGAVGAADAALEVAAAFAFLLALFLVARFGAKAVATVIGTRDDEVLTILFVGLAILVAGLAEEIGVSAAIGALMVGLILGGTDLKVRIERLVGPLRDAFGAVFFFAFGLTIDPADVGSVALPVAVAVVVTLVLNLVAGTIGARVYGFGRTEAANAGTTLLGRGEFSLILASLAAAAGFDERLGPFLALYVLVLAVLGPFLASRSAAVATVIPRRLVERRDRAPAG